MGEDYWEKKIGEERTFYEEQLAVSENQFKELELRLKEYREMLNSMEASKLDGEDKLFAIEEQPGMEESVNEWEEEITQLKLQIEDLKILCDEEVAALKEEITKSNIDKLKKASCKRCADFAALKEKRRNLELSWSRVVENDTNGGRPLPDQSHGPSSLPTYPAMFDGEEVKRRQDLRQCIQDDYDKMLLKKERLNIDQRSQHKSSNSATDDDYVNSA